MAKDNYSFQEGQEKGQENEKNLQFLPLLCKKLFVFVTAVTY